MTIKDKIKCISQYYSKKNQLFKLKEELKELLTELDQAIVVCDFHDRVVYEAVVLPDNTWSECADVLIMIAQITMQHGKEETVRKQIEYKVDRQLNVRIKQQVEWKKKIMKRFTEER